MFTKQPTGYNNVEINNVSIAPGTSALSYTAPDRTEQISSIINEVSSIAKQLSDASMQNHSTTPSTEINEQTREIVFRNVNTRIDPNEVHVKSIAVSCVAPMTNRTSSIYSQPEPTTTFIYYSKI